MRLNACVLVLLLVGSSVAVAADRKAAEVDFLTELVAMRALVRADEVGGYEAFHLAVTRAAGRPFGVKEESEHFGSGGGRITYGDAVADWEDARTGRRSQCNEQSRRDVRSRSRRSAGPGPCSGTLPRRGGSRVRCGAEQPRDRILGRGVGRDRAQAIQWLGAAGKKGLVLAENRCLAWPETSDPRPCGSRARSRDVVSTRRASMARLYEAKADDRRFEEWFWDTAVAAAKGWPPVPAEPLAAYNWFDRAADADFPAASAQARSCRGRRARQHGALEPPSVFGVRASVERVEVGRED